MGRDQTLHTPPFLVGFGCQLSAVSFQAFSASLQSHTSMRCNSLASSPIDADSMVSRRTSFVSGRCSCVLRGPATCGQSSGTQSVAPTQWLRSRNAQYLLPCQVEIWQTCGGRVPGRLAYAAAWCGWQNVPCPRPAPARGRSPVSQPLLGATQRRLQAWTSDLDERRCLPWLHVVRGRAQYAGLLAAGDGAGP